ncbi:unnamed protein product [Urochloa humidicola]
MQRRDAVEDVVIVGAGLAGLATALGLHRKGVRSLVLESSPALRTAGFAFTAWKNAFPDGHGLEPKFLQFIGRGFRSGMRSCNNTDVYWFFTWTPSESDKGVAESGTKLKQFVLTNLTALKIPPKALAVVERSEASDVFAVPLRFRPPLSLVTASISKGGVCVAGDALHPMTPELGQGGCAALEDSVVLARCLGDAILGEGAGEDGTERRRRIEEGLREYAGIRRWRSVELVTTAYAVGFIQQSNNVIVGFPRDKFLSGFLARRLLKMADYDCGTLWSC